MGDFGRRHTVPALTTYLRGEGYPGADVAAWCADFLEMGHGMLSRTERLQRAFSRCTPEQHDEMAAYLKGTKHIARAAPVPGARRLLTTLRRLDIPCAVVSNTKRPLLDRHVVQSGLQPLVGPVISSGHVGIKKPDPASILRALEILGIPPERRASVIYVGNRPHDVAAAAAAGVRPWLVGTGKPGAEFSPVLKQPGVEYFPSHKALTRRIRDVSRGVAG